MGSRASSFSNANMRAFISMDVTQNTSTSMITRDNHFVNLIVGYLVLSLCSLRSSMGRMIEKRL